MYLCLMIAIKLNGWLPSVLGPFEGISYYPREILVGQSRP